MRATTRWILAVLLAASCCALARGVLAAPRASAHLIMKSDGLGDFIGLGEHYNLRTPPWTVEVRTAPWDESVLIDLFPPDWPRDSGKWLLMFSMPGGGPLEEGLYEDVSRWVPAPAAGPRMWIAGEHRGCNTISGWFWVRRADYDAAGSPKYLDIVFRQYCHFADQGLSGRIRWGDPRTR